MRPTLPENFQLAFIGGGNMASAIIGGLVAQGLAPGRIQVIEPLAEQRARLQAQWPVRLLASADASLAGTAMAVWAVKPQTFAEAAGQAGPYLRDALHLSVAAGLRSDSLAAWLGSERIVRGMPNTPALIGQGITGLYGRPAVSTEERAWVDAVIASTGQSLWLGNETDLDAVTALSGSGPAYVFYFIEAMAQAGVEMGLPAEQALRLAKATFTGASALAQASSEAPQVLRERVTSKGGTTHAALSSLEAAQVQARFKEAMQAARQRARELGDEFGRVPGA